MPCAPPRTTRASWACRSRFDDKGDVATPSLSVYQVKGKGFELVKTVIEVAPIVERHGAARGLPG